MGMNSTVLAVVPYAPDICDCLDLGPRAYADTAKGSPVVGELFFMRTSSASRDLAGLLEVCVDDPKTHFFTQPRAQQLAENALNLERLHHLCETAGNPGDAEHFSRLAHVPGAMFFFRPNG